MDRLLVFVICAVVTIAVACCVGYGAYKFQKSVQDRFAAVMDSRLR